MTHSFNIRFLSRLDVGNIRVEFESSYEQTGPFGAKSIGEIVINTPSPALAHAVYNATKVNIRTSSYNFRKNSYGNVKNKYNNKGEFILGFTFFKIIFIGRYKI